MTLLDKNAKRLGIYFFYDDDGVVDKFVTYFLEDLVKSLERLIIVCNGKLTPDGRTEFLNFTEEIIVRENKGLDVWAYKTALEYAGWENLRKYDEVIMLNSTIMGPIYPFEEMFLAMSKKDVDFWGITKTHKIDNSHMGRLPEHIQSHFIVYRNSLLKAPELKIYWDKMPEIKGYYQSVKLYESAFSKTFYDKGFKWDVYVDTSKYEGIVEQPVLFYPMQLIRDERCPIFKRRSFFHDYDDTLQHTTGQDTLQLYMYLEENHLYPTDLIWDNLLRCYNLSDIAKHLHLNHTLSSKHPDQKNSASIIQKTKIAFCMHLYFADLIQTSLEVIRNFPEGTHVYLTTSSLDMKEKIEREIERQQFKHVNVRIVENRGRDVSALLIGLKDIADEYDLICFSHDKKTVQISKGSVGESFAYKCYSNVLFNKTYIENVIALFESQSRLGLAVPPHPNHAEFRQLYGNSWTVNYKNTVNLCKELNVKVPMSIKKESISPFGSVFWFRTAALKKLFTYDWKYDDFDEEPMDMDGTISHAIERCYSYVAQSEGYYSSVIMSDLFQRIEYTNLSHYLSHECNQTLMLEAFYESTSWKITKPIRIVGKVIRRILGKENL